MKKTLITSAILALTIFLTGCQSYKLVAEQNPVTTHNGLIYSVSPYNQDIHQQYKINPLLTNLNLSTTFIIKIKNTTESPIWTKVNNSFVLIDSNNQQHSPFEDTYPFVGELFQQSEYSDLSYSEIQGLNLELERLQDQDISSENHFLYEKDVETMQSKLYGIEKHQMLKMEIERREKELADIMKRYGFKDQLVYPEGESVSLIFFPSVVKHGHQKLLINFILDNNKTITMPYKFELIN